MLRISYKTQLKHADDEIQYEESRSLSPESRDTIGDMSWFWVCQIDVIPGYLRLHGQHNVRQNAALGQLQSFSKQSGC